MTKKDLLEANDRLLKKRKQNQENKDILGQILSTLKKSGPSIARKYALQYMNTEYRDELIKIFKNQENPSFQCKSCNRLTPRKFLENFLGYNYGSPAICDQCNEALEKETEKICLEDKKRALKLFDQQKETILDQMLIRFLVPKMFIKARETDLKGPIMQKLEKKLNSKGTSAFNYFITGGVGTGKTHLAVILLRKFLESIQPVYNPKQNVCSISIKLNPIFVTVPELLLSIRECYQNKPPKELSPFIPFKELFTEREIIEHYSKTPFLILDDLGVEKTTDWSLQTLYIIINRRYVAPQLVTVITSNLSLDDLADKLNERISSRIAGMCKSLLLTGNDKRLRD